VKSINGAVALALAQTTAPGRPAPAHEEKTQVARDRIRRCQSLVKGHGRPCCITAQVSGLAGFGILAAWAWSWEHPVVYSFATWSSLVHNLGALDDWSAFLFSF